MSQAMKSEGNPAQLMALQIKAAGLPEPETEYRFHPDRKWRIDFCWHGTPFQCDVALEIEGGTWSGGRHTRGQGFQDDIYKYNEIALAGYILIRATTQDVDSGYALKTLERALAL